MSFTVLLATSLLTVKSSASYNNVSMQQKNTSWSRHIIFHNTFFNVNAESKKPMLSRKVEKPPHHAAKLAATLSFHLVLCVEKQARTKHTKRTTHIYAEKGTLSDVIWEPWEWNHFGCLTEASAYVSSDTRVMRGFEDVTIFCRAAVKHLERRFGQL